MRAPKPPTSSLILSHNFSPNANKEKLIASLVWWGVCWSSRNCHHYTYFPCAILRVFIITYLPVPDDSLSTLYSALAFVAAVFAYCKIYHVLASEVSIRNTYFVITITLFNVFLPKTLFSSFKIQEIFSSCKIINFNNFKFLFKLKR